MLFDDGETQILIDGFFTRRGILELLTGPISTDIANVNFVMAEYRINRLAAIIPAHSHFDHAMDVGIVANRSSAVVLGSESTANIVRGADLPTNQYQILADREERHFGDFSIQLIASQHAPVRDGKGAWYPGRIAQPLRQPARVEDWKQGVSYSIVISHPNGTALVQGSAGFVPGNLAEVEADVVMLGIGGLGGLGQDYAEQYWDETVRITGAKRVFPVHYDDFSRPFGEIKLFPPMVDDSVQAAQWINHFAKFSEQDYLVERLPFGKPIFLY